MDPAISSDMTRKTTGRYDWGYRPVATTVGGMPDLPLTGPTLTGPTLTGPTLTGPTLTGPTLASDQLAEWRRTTADCRAVGQNLRLPALRRAAERALEPAPSLRYADYPREVGKREIEVSEAAARLAAALHLHLD